MPRDTRLLPATTDANQAIPADLVVVHQTTVFDPNGKGWRTTVRIQDGWQGATLSTWSRGGSDCPSGAQKAKDDAEVAMGEALQFLAAF